MAEIFNSKNSFSPVTSLLQVPGVLPWLQKILLERFGVAFSIVSSGSNARISLEGNHSYIEIQGERSFFSNLNFDLPCVRWNAEAEGWDAKMGGEIPAPGVAELPSPLITYPDGQPYIAYDILGIIYWMLTRQEEIGCTKKDEHGRFPATASHAFMHGYLDRPVVDEWLDVLKQVILKTWPFLQITCHVFKINTTCDVDTPYLPHTDSFYQTCRVVMGDVVKRNSLPKAFITVLRYVFRRFNNFSIDPFWQGVQWIMNVNEARGRQVTFYFIGDHPKPSLDGYFPLTSKPLKKMFKEIINRGHAIGLHPSYLSYDNLSQTVKEADLLRIALRTAGGDTSALGSRQHYLRWAVEKTAANLVAASIVNDSTLGFADYPGFRCGTCFDFPMYDPVNKKMLPLRQRPLVMMESTVIEKAYLGLGSTEKALSKMLELKRTCSVFGGQYTFLWHNSSLESSANREIYLKVIQ